MCTGKCGQHVPDDLTSAVSTMHSSSFDEIYYCSKLAYNIINQKLVKSWKFIMKKRRKYLPTYFFHLTSFSYMLVHLTSFSYMLVNVDFVKTTTVPY